MSEIYSEQYQNFLIRLRSARKDSGLTQMQVAEYFDKPQSYVAKCENGERRIDIIELVNFAKLYEKSLDFFIS